MGFNSSNICFDTADRKNKYPSPICFFVQIPHDVRILLKSESPYFDLQGCFHEAGHAVHTTSISESLEYWQRYTFPMGVAEIFSIFFERLTKNRLFLQSIGIDDQKTLDALKERNNFMDLFFVNYYAANSLMKLDFWKSGLNIAEASREYEKLMNYYIGHFVPGQYWLLHHILPDAVMYVPSYLLAAVRAAELERSIENTLGEKWWLEKQAGKLISDIMEPGANISLSAFSHLDVDAHLGEIGA